MIEGLYSGEFETPFGVGTGVLYLANGLANGGNSALCYIGEYKLDESGPGIKIRIHARRYAPNVPIASVFGLDDLTIFIEGIIDGENIKIDGVAEEVPDMQMQGYLRLLKPKEED
ncbi:hypothetical protein [Sneathiella glossodoripedis]|uniref:hypothetical protein n=1 Tax=Sneathiella glossodoripedis TaxID=418853 RepID=UPI00046FA3A4|nr:hypothetical protein [Sneathiella glossodoripedis]